MAIIDSHNRKRGVTYVYESLSYWDKELKQPRSKRRLLGRRDPSTGDIIPTRKHVRQVVTPAVEDGAIDYATLYKRSLENIRKKDELIHRLRKELSEAKHLLQTQGKGIARAVEALQKLESAREAHNA